MPVKLLSAAVAVFALSQIVPGLSHAEENDPAEHGHVPVNGIDYYYEVHGTGEPLLLLHGGLGQFDMFAPILPTLTESRKVIGVDLHGHGRTALTDRPMDMAAMGRDMAVLVEKLGHPKVDVMGYSMGAGVAGHMAAQAPESVGRLVLVSGSYEKDGFYPEIVEQMHAINAEMAEQMTGTPMYKSYAAVAPKVEDFPKLLDAMGAMMRRPDAFTLDVEKLTMPVMLVYGDADMFRLDHVVDFYKRLGGGQGDPGWGRERMPSNRLAILPNRTHYEIFAAPDLVPTVMPFLKDEGCPASWAEQVGTAD